MKLAPLHAALLVLLFAAAHFGASFVVHFAAGVSGMHSGWKTASALLGFPLTALPDWKLDGVASVALWIAHSLLWGALGAGWVLLALRGGKGFLIAAALAAALPLSGIGLHVLLRPGPTGDWRQAWFGERDLHIPWVFVEADAEKALAEAIQGTHTSEPPQPETDKRWYWNYRATLSGHPEYDAVILVADAKHHDRAAFLAELGRQRQSMWSGDHWEPLQDGPDWELGTRLPGPIPGQLVNFERHRVLRIVGKRPQHGVWIGAIAWRRKLSPERMIELYRHAADGLATPP